MASPDVDVSTGITLSFPTSGFTSQILDVTPPPTTCAVINTSHQNQIATSSAHTKMPGDILDHGSWTFECHFKPDEAIPVGTQETNIVITYANSETWTFDGFISGYAPNAPLEDKMTATVTVEVDGDITIA